MGVCNCSIFCCMLLYVHSSIAIILMGKRELVALLLLSSWCLVMVERLFLAVPWGCLRFVIVVFPDHTHLLLYLKNITDSPLSNCGSIENVQHCFFHCRVFQHQLTLLLNDIRLYRTPTLYLWLYGDPLLSNKINQSIFHHVHRYILATQRF